MGNRAGLGSAHLSSQPWALDYLRHGRLFSYAHQLSSVIELAPASVLEVGVGARVVSEVLRVANVKVVDIDIVESLVPSVVASVLEIPFSAGTFEVSSCCQVLEHLPFSSFLAALRELRRVTSRALILSLPDVSPHYYFGFRLPKIRHRQWTWTRRRLRPPRMTKERSEVTNHQWEIGFRDYPLCRVEQTAVSAGWRIARTWRVPEKHWHRFFDLRAGD